MNDPFNSLRGESPQVNPDDRFVDSVMRLVQQRLNSPSVASHDDTDLTDLEVIPMNTQTPKRTWWLVAAAVVLLVAGLFAITSLRDDDNKLEPAAPSTSTTPTYDFFDGEVSVSASDSWELSWRFALALTLGDQGEERIELLADPFPVAAGCERGLAPADAGALARSIQSDPDLAVSAPVGVDIGGVDGLAMDVTVAPGASVCEWFQSTQVLTQNDSHTGPSHPGVNLEQGSRMRLYLVDLPTGSTTRILAIAVVAPEARFEDVVDAAAPIIESIQFQKDGS